MAASTAPLSIPARTFTRSDNFPDATPPATLTTSSSYFGMIPPTRARHFSHTPDPLFADHKEASTTKESTVVDGFFLQDTSASSSEDTHDSSDLDMSSSDSEATDEEDWEAMGSEVLRAKAGASPGSFASWRSGGAGSFAVGSPNRLTARSFIGSPNAMGRSFVGSPNVATSYGMGPGPWGATWEGPRAQQGRKPVAIASSLGGLSLGGRKGYGRPGPSALSGISKLASSGDVETTEEERARKESEAIEALVSLRSI